LVERYRDKLAKSYLFKAVKWLEVLQVLLEGGDSSITIPHYLPLAMVNDQ
jgi:hypothetical protein